MKFLNRAIDERNRRGSSVSNTYRLPLVKLDINQGADECECEVEGEVKPQKRGITSALAGLTHQPGGEKICTLQVNTGNVHVYYLK